MFLLKVLSDISNLFFPFLYYLKTPCRPWPGEIQEAEIILQLPRKTVLAGNGWGQLSVILLQHTLSSAAEYQAEYMIPGPNS